MSQHGSHPRPSHVRREAHRDYYWELIEGSRWMTRDQAAARSEWFHALPVKNKEQLFFEFEMLLKGLICFGNPVNHPGQPRRNVAAASRDFGKEINLLRDIIDQVVQTGKQLGGRKERPAISQRYLQSVIARDAERLNEAKRALTRQTPEESFALLIWILESQLELLNGLTRLVSVPYSLFRSVVRVIELEIHRSIYFNPLAAVEFAAEFDRIRSAKLVDMVLNIEGDAVRRVCAITLLIIERLLRYLDFIKTKPAEQIGVGPMLAWFSVLRSDIRALVIFFKRDTAKWFSDGFGHLFEHRHLAEINAEFDQYRKSYGELKQLKELLCSLGDQLLLEQRKAFRQQLPTIRSIKSLEQFSTQIRDAAETLRIFLQNAVLLVAREFLPSITGAELYQNFISKREQSDRLRRDIWMFQQVLRGFIVKAKDAAGQRDQWAGLNTFRFVQDFVSYFRSMGYQILRYSDYDQFDTFMNLIERLREGDALELQRFPQLVAICEDFQKFLETTFEAVSNRSELKNKPFDRKEAANTLKLFLMT